MPNAVRLADKGYKSKHIERIDVPIKGAIDAMKGQRQENILERQKQMATAPGGRL